MTPPHINLRGVAYYFIVCDASFGINCLGLAGRKSWMSHVYRLMYRWFFAGKSFWKSRTPAVSKYRNFVEDHLGVSCPPKAAVTCCIYPRTNKGPKSFINLSMYVTKHEGVPQENGQTIGDSCLFFRQQYTLLQCVCSSTLHTVPPIRV